MHYNLPLQVSSYDLINKHGNYSQKVRRLGEFHPILAARSDPDGQDIDDPLYGNIGGEAEKVKGDSPLHVAHALLL